jgi:signal transduction histidine kinase
LFQLFGFLDTTKELNTKGIGLGLHISKKIVQEFGGDINFTSKWGEGTTFTFVLALNKNTQTVNQVVRNKNPKKKIYPKIEIIR